MRSPLGGDLLARRYRLIDRVGAGGMSVVWRARDEVLDRLVAVKWLGADLADDALFRDLVRREAWATARIKHPAVAAVYDYGEIAAGDGRAQAYVVMEMLDGEPLSARLRRGPMPWREAVAIGAEVADALATAHEHGVVHRDVSPDNVMLTSSGLRVFDFGIAAAIGEPDDDATGSTFGTPAYVAPERLDGQPAHTATDVYCLGVLLFEMLTGAPPFPEDTWDPEAPLRERPLPRPRGVSGLPAAVARLCQRCLAFDPSARPPAREVANRLAAYARPRWRAPAAIAAGAVAVLATAAVAFATPPSGPPPGVGAAPAASLSTSDSSGSTSAAPLIVPGTTSAAAPTPAPTSSAPASAASTPGPTPPVVPPAALPVGQALTSLRTTIDDAVTSGALAADIALDLRNSVDTIDRKWMTEPKADLTPMVDTLRTQVITRSQGLDASGNLRMTVPARDALLASIAQLRTSTTTAAAA